MTAINFASKMREVVRMLLFDVFTFSGSINSLADADDQVHDHD